MFGNTAIIGAGISGLTLALFLQQRGFNVTIYEKRSSSARSEGAITLSPNGLKAIQELGNDVVNSILSKGYGFQNMTFIDAQLNFLDSYQVGCQQKYGYNAYRIYRQVILDGLKELVLCAGIPTFYNQEFSHVVSESTSPGVVAFKFTNGRESTANILIGADGIHSKVRDFLMPNLEPTWSGAVAVSCISPTGALSFPPNGFESTLPVSIHGSTGAVHMAPQNSQRTELLVAVQWTTFERPKAGWKELNHDKVRLRGIMEAVGGLNDITKAAIKNAPDCSFSIWPFYSIPTLRRWYSDGGRVVILGDAAHAVPPTGGQGANQALEDVHMLALLMAAVRDEQLDWQASLQMWQQTREGRVAKVKELAAEIRARRNPGWTGEGTAKLTSSWLFNVDLPGVVEQWIMNEK